MVQLVLVSSPEAILTCPPIVAEVGFSARNGPDHDRIRRSLAQFPECAQHPSTELVLDIQQALWDRGLVRAVGAIDTMIAAYAVLNNAVVVHYDSDFEHVAAVWPTFRQRWVVPRGTLDM